ncbi:ABC transporter substrate-binding protein [Sphingobacteriaceae bacterium WQ 2009]|uniref:ABC transporter substrate-binding protein n=1 Tax=Rhinopithecimicrobium faecis TaxID=2820698 RepID=A0A8T4H733_9SPHI|nr:ABC transporter substrate-binding protein [Sphingobacteriaceae bacterium WQ 2009]
MRKEVLKRGLLLVSFTLMCCLQLEAKQAQRIISLAGAITEAVDALGLGKRLVAVDVTSDWPVYVKEVPKVSTNRSITAEGISSFKPDMVLAIEGSVSKEVVAQLRSLKIPLLQIRQAYSAEGAIALVMQVSEALNVREKGLAVTQKMKADLAKVLTAVKQRPSKPQNILFVYARGAGAMLVAGKETSLDALIKLAGAKNAGDDFSQFKTYSTESMVAANPDIFLMFDFGLSSLGGKEGLLALPGVGLTSAGKNKRVIALNAALINNFSVRLPEAVAVLYQAIHAK